ncbi:MAG: zinc ribbon domain-containing protein [Candidatus Zixiibacteriota bacterium]|nr:MAG: zinc ribbon domain-containing protein [candidate division Zixibacteria bacterium]
MRTAGGRAPKYTHKSWGNQAQFGAGKKNFPQPRILFPVGVSNRVKRFTFDAGKGLMPIFEYRCPDCQQEFDEIRPFADRDEPVSCPHCGSRRSERKISLFGTTGWSSGGGSAPSSSCGGHGGFT